MTPEKDPVLGEKSEHPSFGIISISRGTCSSKMNLFGSSIQQRAFIQMEIHQATLYRNLNEDYVHPKGIPIVAVYMSPTQFANAITSLNSQGTPCTIHFKDGKHVDEPKLESKRVQFDAAFEEKMRKIASSTNEYYTAISKILAQPNIGKHARQEILKQLNLLKMQIESNIPFMKKQFTRQMNRTVLEAKNEFDAHMESRIKRLGLEKFTKELKALEHKKFGEEK